MGLFVTESRKNAAYKKRRQVLSNISTWSIICYSLLGRLGFIIIRQFSSLIKTVVTKIWFSSRVKITYCMFMVVESIDSLPLVTNGMKSINNTLSVEGLIVERNNALRSTFKVKIWPIFTKHLIVCFNFHRFFFFKLMSFPILKLECKIILPFPIDWCS